MLLCANTVVPSILNKQTYVGTYPSLILSEYFIFSHSVFPGTDTCQQLTKKQLEMRKKNYFQGQSLTAALLEYDPCQDFLLACRHLHGKPVSFVAAAINFRALVVL